MIETKDYFFYFIFFVIEVSSFVRLIMGANDFLPSLPVNLYILQLIYTWIVDFHNYYDPFIEFERVRTMILQFSIVRALYTCGIGARINLTSCGF